MIYEALIVPSESPPTLRQIKRALLSFDKVIIIDPSDRELFPRNAFFTAFTGMPLLDIDTGPVRPMGKTAGYDERFERTVDYCRSAVNAGVLEVRSTFLPKTEPFTMSRIGGVDLGGYPLSSQVVLALYRGMAQSQDLLQCAVRSDLSKLCEELSLSGDLAHSGQADGSFNGGPPLPPLIDIVPHEFIEPVTQIARARLGAVVKYAGYCETKALVPVFPGAQYAATVAAVVTRAHEALEAVGLDLDVPARSRVLDLLHEDFLVDQLLDSASVNEVLKLRTVVWGEQAAARERLFSSIYLLAKECRTDGDFETRARLQISDYRRVSESLCRERSALSHSIKCDLGAAALASTVTTVGLLTQLESPLASVAATLALGGAWSLERIKEYKPRIQEIQAQTSELQRGAGLAVHDYFSKLRGAA